MEEVLLRLKNKNIKLIQLSNDKVILNMCCELSDLELDDSAIEELKR